MLEMRQSVCILLSTLMVFCLKDLAFAGSLADATEQELTKCLNDPDHASTADQDECEMAALKSYDQRMNYAYSRLLKSLPAGTANDLKAAQRTWILYRDQEAQARSALFNVMQGTMYAPMQSDAETTLTKDRALLLEQYLRVLRINGQ
ncbi:lysozyme inhibitor LprI family protein [Rhizobium sp. HT1-10]|uniref:lysozyme inhibitor LprI family protein n=1 Tax=Rhizobium sp. HT1-10 TaxID=3111638 RepID=UPI003C2396D6